MNLLGISMQFCLLQPPFFLENKIHRQKCFKFFPYLETCKWKIISVCRTETSCLSKCAAFGGVIGHLCQEPQKMWDEPHGHWQYFSTVLTSWCQADVCYDARLIQGSSSLVAPGLAPDDSTLLPPSCPPSFSPSFALSFHFAYHIPVPAPSETRAVKVP